MNAIDDDDYDVANGSDVDGVSSVVLEAMIDMSIVANEHVSEMYIYSFFTWIYTLKQYKYNDKFPLQWILIIMKRIP